MLPPADPTPLFEKYIDLLAMLDLLESDRANAFDSILSDGQKFEIEEIRAELDGRIQEAGPMIDQAKKRLGLAIVQSGDSLRTDTHTASLVKGRVKWNTEMLENLAYQYPEILEARSQGDPYVVIKIRNK